MKIFFIASFTFLLLGCAVTKEYAATGGSRADGIIKLSYEQRRFEIPKVNEQQALNLARDRCKSWGYNDAQSFGGIIRTCNESGLSQCEQWLITKEFQCLGSLEK